jgi:cell wall-associated NlpC family hydrolase
MTRVATWFNARRRIAFRSTGLAVAAIAFTAGLPAAATSVATATAAGPANDPLATIPAVALLAPAADTTIRLPPPRADRADRPVIPAATAAAVTKPKKPGSTSKPATTKKTTKKSTSRPATRQHRKTTAVTKPAVRKPAAKTTSTVTVSGSGKAETAVRFALAQVGKPYVWGAAGPGSYDCSGLVAAAFARVGVRLPHQSGQIGGYGRSVSRAQLQRGDVILYGGHVAIALGGGMMVHAANPRTGITVAKIYGSPIGYRRMV